MSPSQQLNAVHHAHNRDQLTRRAGSPTGTPKTAYTIVLPAIVGSFLLGLSIYLVFRYRKCKAQAEIEKERARAESMEVWGRNMGEPMKKKKRGGDNVLLGSQGVGMGLAAAGT